MKKLLMAVVAVMLIVAMTMSALAVTMYVNTDPGKVYNKNSKKSKNISKLPFGDAVDVFETKGDWSHINYINRKGIQKSGWMLSKNLSTTQPCKHNWGKWKVTKKATCTKEGEKEHTCTKCGVTKTKKIEKTEHDWGKWQVTREATCTKAGERVHKCKVCGTKKTGKIEKKPHTFGEWTVVKQPTCTQKGERARVCDVCDYKQTSAIDMVPHSFGDWTTLVAPTRDSDGERVCTCEMCGYEQREVIKAEPSIARKEHSEAVRAAQRMLNDLGYKAGGADGAYGPKMDKAFGEFAQDKGINFTPGAVKPSQLDALVNAWIAARPEEDWHGENGLSLEVTLDEATDDIMSFSWYLTNEGSEACTLNAVVMGKGSEIDFNAENMVGELDTIQLRANGQTNGTITLPAGMCEDIDVLSFCAIATEKNGGTWTSNVAEVDLY